MNSADLELLDSFEKLTLPLAQWNQRTHVSIGYIYLRKHGIDDALELMRHGVKAFNQHNDIADTPTSGYNETTTVAFLRIIRALDHAYDGVFPTQSSTEFCDAHPQLMNKHVLRFFYSPSCRMHPDAKTKFVEPDLGQLPQRRMQQQGVEMNSMQYVLVYGDSLSWGIIPGSRKRLPFQDRWPGMLEIELKKSGVSVRVVEDCLNGRRTVWDDPIKPGRKGIEGLAQRIEVNSPLDLVILFLGTNDFQSTHQNSSADSADGLKQLVTEVQSAPIEPTMRIPEILIVAPPDFQKAKGEIHEKFADVEIMSRGLNSAFADVARTMGCHFFDAAGTIQTSKVDGVHLDLEQHARLGRALVPVVRQILAQTISEQFAGSSEPQG